MTAFPDILTKSGAVFSPCEAYRHLLWRWWGPGSSFLHITALNPSTADAEFNDNTVRREIDFAHRWGYDGLLKTNAFDFRATKPEVMLAQEVPCSAENDWWIYQCSIRSAHPYGIAAWGGDGNHLGRADYLRACYAWWCFGINKDGSPKHPLYLPKTTTLVPYPRAA